MNEEKYNKEPVYYCRNCLSLRIRDVAHIDNSEYCDECGSTNIGYVNISAWNNMYREKYGHNYLDKYNN